MATIPCFANLRGVAYDTSSIHSVVILVTYNSCYRVSSPSLLASHLQLLHHVRGGDALACLGKQVRLFCLQAIGVG